MRNTATSISVSLPTRPASNVRPSASVTRMRRAFATTWALVRIWPSEAKMKPEPKPPPNTVLTRRPPSRSISMRTTAGPTRSAAPVTAFE